MKLFLIVLVLLIVCVLLFKPTYEKFTNLKCQEVEAPETMDCGDIGTISSVFQKKEGDKTKNFLKCCMPTQEKICINNTCITEQNLLWLLQAPAKLEEMSKIIQTLGATKPV